MSQLEQIAATLTIALAVFGAPALLLWLRRRSRNWNNTLRLAVIVVPFSAFCICGGAAWLATFSRVVILGDTSVPDRIGQSITGYLAFTFIVCGAYCAGFALMGLAICLPVFLGWYFIHPRSFLRITTRLPSTEL